MVLGYHEGSQGITTGATRKETGASGSVPERCGIDHVAECEWRSESC